MDVRKDRADARKISASAELWAAEKSALINAMSLIGTFSSDLLSLKDREGIRAHLIDTIKRLLGVESVHLFYSASESTQESVRSVFEQGESRLQNLGEGDSECVIAVKGAGGVLAVIRAAERTDWTPFTAADISVLDSLSVQLGLRLENLRLTAELARHLANSIQALAAAIEVKDRYTSGHTKRVGVYAEAIVKRLPIIDSEKEKIRLAGVLHDIGKIGVPDRILLKPAQLTESEWDEMRLHTEAGFDIVSRIEGLEEIAEILRHHHERWDGSGYPRGLRGEEIPFASRVIAVADTFDAIITDRPYRLAMKPAEAREIIVGHAGRHFDPVVVQAFEAAFLDLEASARGHQGN